MNSQRKLASLGVMLVAFGACALACEAETGPGAPKRENGCIDLTCAPGSSTSSTSSGDGGGTVPDGG